MAFIKRQLFAVLATVMLASSAFALTTQVIPGQDISFRNCLGVTGVTTGRTLDIYGDGCMNGLARFDLSVVGSAGLAAISGGNIALQLPIATAVTGPTLTVTYLWTNAPSSWNEQSQLAALTAPFAGTQTATVALTGQAVASVNVPLPANILATPILEVRFSTDSLFATAITTNQIVSIGSRRASAGADRSRAVVVMTQTCAESTTLATTTCYSASAFGYSNETAGFCASGSSAAFCDCHSGMYGGNCGLNATSLGAQCAYATFGVPQALSTNFPPLVARNQNNIPSNRYENNRLILNIESPLVQRRVRSEVFLGNPTTAGYPDRDGCRYPGYFWNKEVKTVGNGFTPANDSLSCVESYQASIPWGTALNCGWTQDQNVKPGFTVYRSTLFVQHTEHLPGLRGTSFTERNLQHIIPIQVAFPRTVTVSTNVTIFSFVNLQAAIVAQKVLLPGTNGVDTPQGRLVLATSLQWPFTLTTVDFTDLGTGQRFTFNIDSPQPTQEGSFTEDCLAQAAAGNPNPICNQLYGLFMLPLPNTCDLNGRYQYTFRVACRGDQANCPLGAANDPARTAVVTVQLKSEDFCAKIEIDINAKGTLKVFNNPARTVPATAFLFENPPAAPQRAYFRADVSSDQASISRTFVSQVSVYPANDPSSKNLLFTQAAGAASGLYNFTSAEGIDFAFFDVDVIPASFPGVDVDANIQFTVEAVLGIEFEQPTFGGAKKRSIEYKTFSFKRGILALDTKSQSAAATAAITSGARAASTPSTSSSPKTAAAPGTQQGGLTNSASVSAVSVFFGALFAVIALLF